MQNAKGKAKFKTSPCKSQGCVWATGRGWEARVTGGAKLHMREHGSLSPWIPAHRTCRWHTQHFHPVLCCGTGASTWQIPAICPTKKVKSSAVCFPKFLLMLWSRNTLLSSRTAGCQGQESFPSHFTVLWNRVQTVVTAGKLLAGIGQDEMEQKLTLIFNTDCSCNKILTLHSSHHKAKPEPWLSAGGNITSSTKKPNRAKSRSPAGDY